MPFVTGGSKRGREFAMKAKMKAQPQTKRASTPKGVSYRAAHPGMPQPKGR